jgi:hypothetical protein
MEAAMNQPSPATICVPIELRLVPLEGDAVPVRASFEYDPGDPFAVRAEFHLDEAAEPVVWVFARDLVTEGLRGPAGQGDVSLWPARSDSGPGSVVCLALSSPDGQALFECDTDRVVEFLERTFATVPPGDESRHLDLDDGALERLLDES